MTQPLEPDVYRRDALPPLPGARRRTHDAWVFGALMAVSIGLVVVSKFEPPLLMSARSAIHDITAPLLNAAQFAMRPFLGASRMIAEWQTVADERNRLREENERLKGWEARAQALEQRASALADLTHVVEQQALAFITARVVTGASGPFVRAAIIEAGRDHGLKPGFPVVTAQGLAGRLITTGARTARLLLVTDHNSRIPVIIGPESARAIMHGDNSPYPRIVYSTPDVRIKPGDDVFTSGVGGMFPRGLRIGTVVEAGERMRIEPSARLDRLDYVSVLFSESLSALLAEEERAVEARAGARRLVPSQPASSERGLPK